MRKIMKKTIGIWVCLTLALTAIPAMGAIQQASIPSNDSELVVDQAQEGHRSKGLVGHTLISGISVAQSFVPSGKLLAKVDLKISEGGYVKASIRESLDGRDLTSKTMRITSTGEWISFDFRDINVVIGKTYYIVVTATDRGFWYCFLKYAPEDAYTHGESFKNNDGSWAPSDYTPYPGRTLHFDTCFRTYTDRVGIISIFSLR